MASCPWECTDDFKCRMLVKYYFLLVGYKLLQTIHSFYVGLKATEEERMNLTNEQWNDWDTEGHCPHLRIPLQWEPLWAQFSCLVHNTPTLATLFTPPIEGAHALIGICVTNLFLSILHPRILRVLIYSSISFSPFLPFCVWCMHKRNREGQWYCCYRQPGYQHSDDLERAFLSIRIKESIEKMSGSKSVMVIRNTSERQRAPMWEVLFVHSKPLLSAKLKKKKERNPGIIKSM